MFAAPREWLNASPLRRRTASVCALAAIAVGVILVYMAFRTPTPPALVEGNADEVFAFLARGDHERMSSADRDRLFSDLGKHYIDSSPEQRQDFEEQWNSFGVDRDLRRRISMQMDLALAFRAAEEYASLDESEKGPFLDRILLMVSAMGGGDKFLDWLDADPSREIVTNPASMATDLTDFQAHLVAGTSAAQRVELTQLGADLRARSKRYRR